jgi:hypothetical protein
MEPKRGFLSSIGWGWLVLLVIATIAPFGAMAQLSGKGAITGTAMDKTGAVIPGATVAATNNATKITTTTTTTGAGDFSFPNLDPGVYTIVTTAKGFEKVAQQDVHVNALESQTYNPVLTVGGSNIEITVTAAPPQLETSNATLGATMENDTYAELPIEMGAFGSPDQRRATDFVYLMPGVQGNETNGNATTNTGVVNGSGSKGAASDVYVDGVAFVRAGGQGDPRYVWTAISVDAIDQFQVQTSGYSAVYEGQGVMNYTIHQGGSKQHGSVYEFFRNTALDTWGFFGKAPNPATGLPVKPIEHSNEYGINLGGPLIPLGAWKEKVFYYANYNGFRYTSATPTPMSFPTPAQQTGDFSATGVAIYDPSSQALCTAHSTNGFCRYQYGYGPGTTTGTAGNPTLIGAGSPVNVIPSTEFSAVAKAMQSFLPATGIGTSLSNNYIAPNNTGLVNWSTTDRIDYLVNTKDTLTFVAAIGRQASSFPVGQTTAGRNVGPIPFNFGQVYAPKTAVGIIEETHVFSPHLINQAKWGYARYNGPTFNADEQSKYAATSVGIGGLPAGQAQQAFPFITFAGTDAPTNWAGEPASVTVAENYTALDNVEWTVGKHQFTFGGQVAWMLYNVINDTSGTSPITLATAVTETAGISGGSYTVASGTGLSYASFLLGQIDKGSFTQYLQQEFGARFRAISPYVQDNWKVTPKLTLDLGLRYDFFPTITEVHNDESYYSTTLANPITGINGALQFTGTGAGTCNCSTPVSNYKKNFGPRLGLAYQLGSKNVIRASYGVMFTHGDAVGGNASSIGTLGFSAAPAFSSVNDVTTMPGLLAGGNGAIPQYTGATGVASGPAFGTGYTQVAGYTGTPSSIGYVDPYLGSRAPEYINWTFGIQRQVTNAIAATATYVGSEGHFLQTDSLTGRGLYSDEVNPNYLYLGPRLADTGTTATTVTADCATYSLPCPNLATFTKSQPLSQALKPFPYQTVSDSFAYIGNANYHAVQLLLNMRPWHGFSFSANYTFSRSIDDGGTFRTGYAIPAGTIYGNSSAAYPADRIERTVSTSSQPQHFVLTDVWDLPIGRTILAGNNMERAILGGFKFSDIYQAYSGSPLAVTGSSCQTNPADSTCEPTLNPGFSGSARQNGKWGSGVTWANYNATSGGQPVASSTFIVPSTGYVQSGATVGVGGPFINPTPPPTPTTTPPTPKITSLLATPSPYDYTFGNSPRTAPYNIYGPGNYQLDLALVRSFPLHITESTKLDFRAEWYNVTNHTLFGVASAAVGNAGFGQVTSSSIANRKAAQFSARISF